MREYKLYLPHPSEQTVQCERWIHLFKQIDREYQEVRVYIAGLDFSEKDAKYPLPYAVLDGKKKSFESLWKKIMINSGKTTEEYIPKND